MRWLLAALLILLAGEAVAQCPPVPFVFRPGANWQPDQVNTNFTELRDCAEGAYSALDDVRRSTDENPTPGSYFVAKTGSDSADCLTSTVSGGHGPCLTIGRALLRALTFDGTQRNVLINIAAGTYDENVALNGPVVGAANNTNFIQNNLSTPMVTLEGADEATTIINGVPEIAGQSYCYTILANNGAQIRLRKLTIKADQTPVGCTMSALFGQVWGTFFVDDSVSLGPVTGNLVSLEQGGAVYVDAGCQNCNSLTFAGGSTNGNGINMDADSWFTSDSTINIPDPITFGGGFMFLVETGSTLKLRGNPAYTDAATVTAARFYVGAGSVFLNATPPTTGAGTIGGVNYGGRYVADDDNACIGGTAGCPAVNVPTGLGGSGTAGISIQSGMYGGGIILSPVTGGGPAPASTGTVEVAWPAGFAISSVCTANLAQGTGTWDAAASIRTSGFTTPTGVVFTWENGGVGLTTAQTYHIAFTCNTSK